MLAPLPLNDFFVGALTAALAERFSAGAGTLVSLTPLDEGVPQKGGGGTKASAMVTRAVWVMLCADYASILSRSPHGLTTKAMASLLLWKV